MRILLFNIPFGFQLASCAIIGQLIGNNKLDQAIFADKVIFRFSIVLDLIVFTCVSYFLKHKMVMIFTGDSQLISMINY